MVGGTDNMPVFNTFPLYDRLYFYGQFIFVLLKKIHRINCRNIQHFAYKGYLLEKFAIVLVKFFLCKYLNRLYIVLFLNRIHYHCTISTSDICFSFILICVLIILKFEFLVGSINKIIVKHIVKLWGWN